MASMSASSASSASSAPQRPLPQSKQQAAAFWKNSIMKPKKMTEVVVKPEEQVEAAYNAWTSEENRGNLPLARPFSPPSSPPTSSCTGTPSRASKMSLKSALSSTLQRRNDSVESERCTGASVFSEVVLGPRCRPMRFSSNVGRSFTGFMFR